ncbi:hypothetical protein K2X33_01120 [bacterium]|nr:hypothetical protein [bacterium]
MKGLLVGLICFAGVSASAARVECVDTKNSVLSFEADAKSGTLHGFLLNGDVQRGYQVLEAILASQDFCQDVSSKVDIKKGEVLVCDGEMFAPKGIYGQVLVTEGALAVLKNKIASQTSRTCK